MDELRLIPCLTPHGCLLLAASDNAPDAGPAKNAERCSRPCPALAGRRLVRITMASSLRADRRLIDSHGKKNFQGT